MRIPPAAALAVLAAAGCGAPSFPAYRASPAAVPDPAVLPAPAGKLAGPVRVVARVVLEVRSAEENLTLHAVLFPSGAAFLVASGDFGREVFAAGRTAGGFRSRGDPRRHPPELLGNLLEDLVLGLLPPEDGLLEPVELAGGEGALHGRRGSREFLLRLREESLSIVAGAGGLRTAEIEAAGWTRDPGGRRIHPGRIVIAGDAVPYRAEVEVLRWEPSGLTEADLEADLREGGPR